MAQLPFGAWPSDIGLADVAAGSVRLGNLNHAAGRLWWTEGRPLDQGRNCLCSLAADGSESGPLTVLSGEWNVRNRVHEYGGGALASDGRRVWFCHDGDAGVHELGGLEGVTPQCLIATAGLRFADLVWCGGRGSLLAVCEDHRQDGREAANRLVEIVVDGAQRGTLRVLAQGADFYSSPAPSPDGRWLAWLSWQHPAMPWDASELWCAEWRSEGLAEPVLLSAGPEQSIFQPAWSPDAELHLVSDHSGWWNLYRIDAAALGAAMDARRPASLRALCPMAAEFGTPQWEFGMRSYGFTSTGTLVAIARSEGRAQLGIVDPVSASFRAFASDWEDFRALQPGADRAWCLAGAPDCSECLIEVDLAHGTSRMLSGTRGATAHFSRPRAIVFPGSGGAPTHAFFYPPWHASVRGPAQQQPPLIVINHGGPTAATSSTLRLAVQFWTSRGFAVLDVNYGGSTGFGRAYRARLDGNWGVVDVEDAVAGVRWLAAQGLVDGARAAIRGSSAGGFTTLAALAFHRAFRAGVSLYGIGDLSLLARDTHKFESRYLDRLVAPWPQGEAIYRARSPIEHIDGIDAALLLLQGEDDRVVPPNQAETMYAAARAKGLPVALLLFPGEQHGFRRADTLIRALAAELAFYGRIFGFEPADALPPLEIANLPPVRQEPDQREEFDGES
ncbi:MAG: S9 family peptidase [Pseudomonadota bacterium]|nr:S9 family peptidase [Pseudomonadota bacterium]